MQGRLGNQMFIYASIFSIAKRNDFALVVPNDLYINKIFRGLDAVKVPKEIVSSFTTIQDEQCCVFNSMFLSMPKEHTVIHSYLQSFKYFVDYEKDIRRQFKFDPSTISKALRSSTVNRSEDSVIVGVHVRRGDYTEVSKLTGQILPPASYIKKAMNHFRKKYSNAVFLIVTDDQPWCEAHVSGNDTILISSPEPEVDLCILSSCNHVIHTLGTFGWWGAWLAGGDVVYYANAAIKDSFYDRMFNVADFFPSSWIKMQ